MEYSKDSNMGEIIDDALTLIEKENNSLKNVLPKNYNSPTMKNINLGELLDLFTNIKVGTKEAKEKDLLGRIYEYFLGQFAKNELQKGGEFYIPDILGDEDEFVCTEFSVGDFRIDSLAFNKETKSFIIIEDKNDQNKSLLAQGLTYLKVLKDRKEAFMQDLMNITGKYEGGIDDYHKLHDEIVRKHKVVEYLPHRDRAVKACEYVYSRVSKLEQLEQERFSGYIERTIDSSTTKRRFVSDRDKAFVESMSSRSREYRENLEGVRQERYQGMID